MSKKKTNPKKDKTVTKKPVDGRKKRNSDFDKFRTIFRDELKKQNIKLKGRGAFLREGSKIWKDVKKLPISNTAQNIDILVHNYIVLPQKEAIEQPAETTKRIVREKDEQIFERWLIKEDLFSFYWWHGLEYFGRMIENSIWKELDIKFLRIVDASGDFRDVDSKEGFRRNVHKIIDRDVKSDRYKSSDLSFGFIELLKENGKNIAVFSIPEWYFGIMVKPEIPVIEEKIPEVKVPEEISPEEKAKEKPKAEKAPAKKEAIDAELDRLIKYKKSIMEDIKFAKEIGEDYKEDLAKYKAVKNKIDQLMK